VKLAPLWVALGVLGSLYAHDAPRSHAGGAFDVRAGVVEGVVTVRSDPPRRRPARYGSGPVEAPQALPALVWLEPIDVPAGAAGAALPLEATLAQEDTLFAPGVVVIGVGGSVDFPNRDAVLHNVFSYAEAARFDLGRYPQGESKSVTFDRPGLVEVFCEVHDRMRAVVLVVAAPFHAELGPTGTFRFSDVPAGTWRVRAWSSAAGAAEVQIEVSDGRVSAVEIDLS